MGLFSGCFRAKVIKAPENLSPLIIKTEKCDDPQFYRLYPLWWTSLVKPQSELSRYYNCIQAGGFNKCRVNSSEADWNLIQSLKKLPGSEKLASLFKVYRAAERNSLAHKYLAYLIEEEKIKIGQMIAYLKISLKNLDQKSFSELFQRTLDIPFEFLSFEQQSEVIAIKEKLNSFQGNLKNERLKYQIQQLRKLLRKGSYREARKAFLSLKPLLIGENDLKVKAEVLGVFLSRYCRNYGSHFTILESQNKVNKKQLNRIAKDLDEISRDFPEFAEKPCWQAISNRLVKLYQ